MRNHLAAVRHTPTKQYLVSFKQKAGKGNKPVAAY